MAGTIVADIIQSDQSYASSINIASPMVVSNTISMTNGAISGNVNFDSGTLFVDSVNNRVGLGVTPAYRLDIENPSGSDYTPVARVGTSRNIFLQPGLGTNGIYGSAIGFHGYFDTLNGNFVLASGRNTYGGAGITSDYDGTLEFYNYYNGSTSGAPTQSYSTAKKMRIDYSGRVTKPYQPAFSAALTRSSPTTYNSVSSGTTIVFDDASTNDLFNIGSNYSTSTGRFTAPVDGRYIFSFSGNISGGGAWRNVQLRVNGTTRRQNYNQNDTSWDLHSFTHIVELATGDYVTLVFVCESSTGTIDANNLGSGDQWNFFSGYLLG